ncbi:MAG: hypothetical protein IJQ12_07055 [Lachnospiraceae bacterium]|nr:hypothetical protein [Lachnospiraceae bacterium]
MNKTDVPGMYYLKWDETVIGTVAPDLSVSFVRPDFNTVVHTYTHGKNTWTREELISFLSERIVSRDRRDIEKILFRCGLSSYDVWKIARITRAIHPKDLLWIAEEADERMGDAVTDVFDAVFHRRTDLTGDSIDTPEGCNIKRYGVYNGQYGIYKRRINPLVTDAESEIAVYMLAEKLGVPCCPTYRIDEDTIFSAFQYDYSGEYLVHFRRLFDGERSDNEYRNLIQVRPQYAEDIARMILLDFITRQDDRHLSNIAVKVSAQGECFYPLYDNGRSLFYEDTEETVQKAVQDIPGYATTFGPVGSYYDHVTDMVSEGIRPEALLHLDMQ